jgi:cyclic beta-1,2-glucan synthetase
MQQAGVESILGFRLRGTNLVIEPCIPRAWPRFEIAFAHHSARYEIAVENPHSVNSGVLSAELDGQPLERPSATIPLVDDGQIHRVTVILG